MISGSARRGSLLDFAVRIGYAPDMDVIDILEERVMHMLNRLKALEEENAALKTVAQQENASLKEALEQERQNKNAVLSRVDQLLKKLQEPAI